MGPIDKRYRKVSVRIVPSLALAALFIVPPSASNLAAQTVGLAPAQAAELAPGGEAATPEPNLVSGCLGELFDAGLIATDAPCAYVGHAEWEDAAFGIAAAEEGSVEYVIALYADWIQSLYRTSAWLIGNVEYRLVRASDGAMLSQGSFRGPEDSYAAASETNRAAASVGSAVGSACAAALLPRSTGGK